MTNILYEKLNSNSTQPAELIQIIKNTANQDVLFAISQHANCENKVLAEILSHKDCDDNLLIKIVQNTNNKDFLMSIISDRDKINAILRDAILENIVSNNDVLTLLLEKCFTPDDIDAVLKHKICNQAINDQARAIQEAKDNNTLNEVISSVQIENPIIRNIILKNEHCRSNILFVLIDKATTKEDLIAISMHKDCDITIRNKILVNPLIYKSDSGTTNMHGLYQATKDIHFPAMLLIKNIAELYSKLKDKDERHIKTLEVLIRELKNSDNIIGTIKSKIKDFGNGRLNKTLTTLCKEISEQKGNTPLNSSNILASVAEKKPFFSFRTGKSDF